MNPVRLARWWTALAIFIAAVALLVGLMMIVLSQMPDIRYYVQCRSHMQAVGKALNRYYWPNGTYPTSLEALRKDYLKDPGVLRCPLDRSPGNRPSYKYHRPTANSPGSMIILECKRHRGVRGNRHLYVVTKSGRWENLPLPAESPVRLEHDHKP